MTDLLFGFDLVIADSQGRTVGFAPVVADGSDDRAALSRLKMQQRRVSGLPPGARVAGVRHHVDFLQIFAGPNSPYYIRGWKPLVGPSVSIKEAKEFLYQMKGGSASPQAIKKVIL